MNKIFQWSHLFDILCKYNLFTYGDGQKIDKLFDINENTQGKYKLKDLALVIYLCSSQDYNDIYKILKEEHKKVIK